MCYSPYTNRITAYLNYYPEMLHFRYPGGSCTHTEQPDRSTGSIDPWWAVDLQANYQVTKVAVYGRGDCCRKFRVFYIIVLMSLYNCIHIQ